MSIKARIARGLFFTGIVYLDFPFSEKVLVCYKMQITVIDTEVIVLRRVLYINVPCASSPVGGSS